MRMKRCGSVNDALAAQITLRNSMARNNQTFGNGEGLITSCKSKLWLASKVGEQRTVCLVSSIERIWGGEELPGPRCRNHMRYFVQ